MRPCTRVRARCVCALAVFARQRVACEELDMSFRGIRHLKREQVKATELGIKHQPTSARKHQLGAAPDLVHLFYFPWIYHLALRVRCTEGAASVNLHLKWMRLNNRHYTGINQHPPLFWVSTFLFPLLFLYFFFQSLCNVFLCLPRCMLVIALIINSRWSDVFILLSNLPLMILTVLMCAVPSERCIFHVY